MTRRGLLGTALGLVGCGRLWGRKRVEFDEGEPSPLWSGERESHIPAKRSPTLYSQIEVREPSNFSYVDKSWAGDVVMWHANHPKGAKISAWKIDGQPWGFHSVRVNWGKVWCYRLDGTVDEIGPGCLIAPKEVPICKVVPLKSRDFPEWRVDEL